jgi:molybdate transport system ATP-binding protein
MAGDLVLDVDVLVAGERAGCPRVEAKFSVSPGITVLFGPSGAGKSTCLAAIAGLLRPARGTITLGAERLFDAERNIDVPTCERKVALVFQSLALFPHLCAVANVAYGLPRALRAAERRRQALAWLERVRVGHVANRRPATFSGGEAQRVALARALASSPRVLLLDEPFSAMDTHLRRELGRDIVALVSELGLPTVLVTHDRDDARALGKRLVLLRGGRIEGMGAPGELLGHDDGARPAVQSVDRSPAAHDQSSCGMSRRGERK